MEGLGGEKDILGITQSERCYIAPEDPTKKKEAEVSFRKKMKE